MSRPAARLAHLACTLAALTPAAAWAGPPYVTDDAETTRTAGWENYLFATGTHTPGTTDGQLGVELNYGAAANLQLSATLPEGYTVTHVLRAGPGELDIGVKYRLLHPPNSTWLPDAALFPQMTVPTGTRGFSTGHATLFLPVWLTKNFGQWSTFCGGGYTLNPGHSQQNYTLTGWALTRNVGDRLNLGVELYHQTAPTPGGAPLTNLGLGAVYQMSKHWAVMASGGPGLQRPARAGISAFYISLQFTN